MLPKLSRQTLTEQATEELIAYIESEHLKPGDVLPAEAKIAESFGVSRSVIREAMKALIGKNIVEMVNGKGAVIREVDGESLHGFFRRAILFNQDAIIEILEVRKGLEIESVRLAAQRATETEVIALGVTVRTMRETLHNFERFSDLDVTFHLQIAAATHNQMLYYLVDSIRGSLKNVILKGLRSRRSEAELERLQSNHEAILAALQSGDTDRSAEAMRLHFDDAIEAFVRAGHTADDS